MLDLRPKGYRGYIPGKHPSNVFGSTFADSNATAMEVQPGTALLKGLRVSLGFRGLGFRRV